MVLPIMRVYPYLLLAATLVLLGCNASPPDASENVDMEVEKQSGSNQDITPMEGYELINAERANYDLKRMEGFVGLFRKLAKENGLDQFKRQIDENSAIVKLSQSSPGLRVPVLFRGYQAVFLVPFKHQGGKIVCMIPTPSGHLDYGLYTLPQEMLPFSFK